MSDYPKKLDLCSVLLFLFGFSKYEFNNKLLDGVTFFRVISGVT